MRSLKHRIRHTRLFSLTPDRVGLLTSYILPSSHFISLGLLQFVAERHHLRATAEIAVSSKCDSTSCHRNTEAWSHQSSVTRATLAACSTKNCVQVCLSGFQLLFGQAPEYFINDCRLVTGLWRSSDNRMYCVLRTHNRFGDSSFCTSGQHLWNNPFTKGPSTSRFELRTIHTAAANSSV